jgi:ketosteroid isomerase-like protein
MRVSERLIVEGTFAAWAAEDLATVAASVHDDSLYVLHLPEHAWPIAGVVRGKQRVMASLAAFLRDFDVVEYRPLKIRVEDGVFSTRARLHYAHKRTGLCYGRRSPIEAGWRAAKSPISKYSTTRRGCGPSMTWCGG